MCQLIVRCVTPVSLLGSLIRKSSQRPCILFRWRKSLLSTSLLTVLARCLKVRLGVVAC
uniref:Uncharacterized protein n=1 Tax=Anguilla anguilla TaxID=7936 RepID=A0A0E9TDC5_ANGAN